MEYIQITKANIEKEHICCAMSNNQSLLKKKWLIERFDEGLVFYRSEERGKCFIEYIPAENAWVPINAPDYLFINCLWIAGSMKGKGYSNDLLDKCIIDAKKQGKKGICILSSNGRKKEFLADPKWLEYKKFRISDEALNGINIMYLPFYDDSIVPTFKECAKKSTLNENGFVIYYTDQCPFTNYWVTRLEEVAKDNNIEFKKIHIVDKKTAQNFFAPVTTYALFYNGKYVTHVIQNEKKFLELYKKLNQ